MNMIPYLLKDISEKFSVNNIYEDKIDNLEHFNQFHKNMLKYKNKEISYFSSLKILENEFVEKNIYNYTKSFNYIYNTEKLPINFMENNRKRIDKENKLIIFKRREFYKKFNLLQQWPPIQNNVLKHFINLYERLNNPKMYYLEKDAF